MKRFEGFEQYLKNLTEDQTEEENQTSLNCKSVISNGVAKTFIRAGLYSGLTSFAGFLGSKILSNKYSDYDSNNAAMVGALGGAVFNGTLGALKGLGFLSEDKNKKSCYSRTVLYVGNAVLSGLTGYAVLNAAGIPVMDLAHTAAAFAVGGAAAMIPSQCALLMLCLPLLVCDYLREEKANNLLATHEAEDVEQPNNLALRNRP